MKKNFIRLFIAVSLVTLVMASCSVLQGVGTQIVGLANLVNCEYSMKNANNVSVAGVSLSNVKNGNITVADIAKLTTAVLAKNVPLTMDVNINVKNPTTTDAALTAMDWIMDIDGTQFATGTSSKAYSIAKSATTTITLPVSTDIYGVCNNVNSLKTFVQSFSNDGTSSKIGLKIKPSLNVAGVVVPSPDYITIQKATGSTNTTTTGSRTIHTK
jgi:predicted small secreted protein